MRMNGMGPQNRRSLKNRGVQEKGKAQHNRSLNSGDVQLWRRAHLPDGQLQIKVGFDGPDTLPRFPYDVVQKIDFREGRKSLLHIGIYLHWIRVYPDTTRLLVTASIDLPSYLQSVYPAVRELTSQRFNCRKDQLFHMSSISLIRRRSSSGWKGFCRIVMFSSLRFRRWNSS